MLIFINELFVNRYGVPEHGAFHLIEKNVRIGVCSCTDWALHLAGGSRLYPGKMVSRSMGVRLD
jgi:hypothetical protein